MNNSQSSCKDPFRKSRFTDLGKMASNRKKQDEKHLKILRNLVSLPGNKQCFDCNQRGPTYVNVTIGSFVCTTCSGSLRGLTPPHRVKSISMATFTPEEIESLQSRGNEYCRKVWLALYDSNNVQDTKDELLVRDFMVAKYEKKRYYVEPSAVFKNGNSSFPGQSTTGAGVDNFKGHHSVSNSSPITSPPPPVVAPAPSSNSRTQQAQSKVFVSSVPAFTLADPFAGVTGRTPRQKSQPQTLQHQQPLSQHQEQSFANFDNNPIFSSSVASSSSSFPLLKPNSPSEDKYAALKDLDCLMKLQQESSQQQGTQANGWLSNNAVEKNNTSLNPFQTDVGNNNVFNPFRSGLIQQAEKNANSNSNYGNEDVNNSYSNGNSSISSSGSSNMNNPWKTPNPWANNALPTSQSMPFPVSDWNGKGDLSVIPGNSNNPFL